MRCDAGAGRVLCDRLCAALGMSRRSVGRSIRFSGGRESSDFFPRPFPLRGRRSIRGKNKSACVSWLHRGQLMSGSGSAGAIPMRARAIRDRHRRGSHYCSPDIERYVPRYLRRYLSIWIPGQVRYLRTCLRLNTQQSII